MQIIWYAYLLISMEEMELREKSKTNLGDKPTELLISQLLIAIK